MWRESARSIALCDGMCSMCGVPNGNVDDIVSPCDV